MSFPVDVQLVLVLVPLLESEATDPSVRKALVGLDWNPLLSPAFDVTAACAVGAKKFVLTIGRATAMLKALVAVAGGVAESVTRTVKLEVPAAPLGVPVIVPFEFRVKPLGTVPLARDHVYGVVPPLAVSVAEYTTANVAPGSEVVATASGDCTVKAVLPAIEPRVAEIVLFPAATPVASPALLIVATAAFEEAQVACAVMFWVLPSEYVPVAVNCRVPPVWIVGLAGVTAMELRAITFMLRLLVAITAGDAESVT